MKKQSKIAQIAIFFAIMLVLHLLSSVIFNLLPVPIKPTIIHIPIIIASILYGPQVGMVLGFLMGCISVITNGNLHSLMIAMVPRILIGLTPYLVYKVLHNKLGLAIAGAVGSATNTIFVLGGIFFLFSNVYQGSIQAMLAVVLSANSIAELLISVVLTTTIVPALEKAKQ